MLPDPVEHPFAEMLQADPEPRGWSADRAHARIRLLAGATGLAGVTLILALLLTGAPTHG